MKLLGGNPIAEVAGLDELPGESNYFIGNDPAKSYTDVPTYAKVKYQDVYPGIDLVYYGNQRQLEYDFEVAPGADPSAIRLGFEGADDLTIDDEGNLIVYIDRREVTLRVPVIFQKINGLKRFIPGGYLLEGKGHVSFQVAAYDASRPLVIDPVLEYSTYLGGGGRDIGRGVAVDTAELLVRGPEQDGGSSPGPPTGAQR